MDKKIRKRIEVLKEKLTNRQRRLAGTRHQPDDDDDLEEMEREIEAIKAELRQLSGQ